MRDYKRNVWICAALLVAFSGGKSEARTQKKTARKAAQNAKQTAAKITLRDLEYETFQAAHPASPYFGAFLPLLPAGKTETRRFQWTGAAGKSAPLVVRVLPVASTPGEKPKALPTIEKTLPIPTSTSGNFDVVLPASAFDANVTLTLTLRIFQNKTQIAALTESFVALSAGKMGTSLDWLGRDDRTQGDWLGVYGRQAFLVATAGGRSIYQQQGISLNTGLGDAAEGQTRDVFDRRNNEESEPAHYGKGESLADKRLPQYGPGQGDKRPPAAFAAQQAPLYFRVEATDGAAHNLSLYILDFRRRNQVIQIDVYDRQRHRLESRKIGNFGEGSYLRYRFSGRLLVVLTSLTPGLPPTTNALFIDP